MEAKDEAMITSVPKWFKVFNVLALTLILSCCGYIIVNNIGNTSDSTSGAGDIWWVDAPEINQSYYAVMERKELSQ